MTSSPPSPLPALLPSSVVTLETTADPEGELYPEERALIQRAVPKRQREFKAGRILAHRALTQLGFEPAPLLSAEDRSPLWPAGARGSITHTAGYAAVAVASDRAVLALGLDAEEARELRPELWRRIMTLEEKQWLESLPDPQRGLAAMAIFSAKESYYKAQHPLTRRFLEFLDVRLELDLSHDSFEVVPLRYPHPWPTDARARGRLSLGPERILTAFCVQTPSAD